MTWLFTLLAMAVIALVSGVATGRITGMDAPESSAPFRGLPPEMIVPQDLEDVRFTPVLRGYRMTEVDDVLDRLGAELRRRDEEIARLNGVLSGGQEIDPLAAGGSPAGDDAQAAPCPADEDHEAAGGPAPRLGRS